MTAKQNGAGENTGLSFSIEIPVRFAETDAMGVAHHSAYIIWFEAARVAWMEAIGLPYAEFAASGHHFSVTGLRGEYRAPARFGDIVRVTATLRQLRSRQVRFEYTVTHATTGQLLMIGATDHICVDLEGKMTRIPDAFVERIRNGMEKLAGRT
ncbi:MAG: acyl-CoA thioesterase [Caldilinea sp.]|nr:acyl-CoA thioesterase [Caldilinea sp.]MDW8442654.1 thioesterase family protein [Caldilineaceae bacterium]